MCTVVITFYKTEEDGDDNVVAKHTYSLDVIPRIGEEVLYTESEIYVGKVENIMHDISHDAYVIRIFVKLFN